MVRSLFTTALTVALVFFAHTPRASADVFSDVPEAKGYTLLYTLNIPLRGGFANKRPTYLVDRAKSFQGSFSRIAYYLTLTPKTGPRQFVYVSMDAFTQKTADIAVPDGTLKLKWQQRVKNMNVVTNVAGVTPGKGLAGGNIEFWSTNYAVANAAAVPGASNTVYDTGDAPVANGTYGSMQIHNHSLSQTLFAYNNWGNAGSNSDLGIGNNKVKNGNVTHTDWTFRRNAAEYTQRTLQVLVLPGTPPFGLRLKVTKPAPFQIHQRQAGNQAMIPIAGRFEQAPDRIEARAVPLQGGQATGWKVIAAAPQGSTFTGQLQVRAGWYKLEVRSFVNGKVDDKAERAPFGVGEILLIAGQSNSANHGNAKTKAQDPRVVNYGAGRWQPAADPMLVATGNGGSPWPTMGDLLVKKWGVPIGIISVGWGGTRVDQWVPSAPKSLYPRLKTAITAMGKRGLRAILWHQGESDAAANTPSATYAQRMNAMIKQTRTDGGWDIPWYIATAAYLPRLSAAQLKRITDGQRQTIASHPLNFPGPTTEDLLGTMWRYDRVHFNLKGLQEHARRWAQVLLLPDCQGFFPPGPTCEPVPEPIQEPAQEPTPEPPGIDATDASEISADAINDARADVGVDAGEVDFVPQDTSTTPDPKGTPDKQALPEPAPQQEPPTTADASVDTPGTPPPLRRRGCACLSTNTAQRTYTMESMLGLLVLLVVCRKRERQ